MPGKYHLRKAPRHVHGDDAYWVITETGRKLSRHPLPKVEAKAQMRAVYAKKGSSLEGEGLGDIIKYIASIFMPATTRGVSETYNAPRASHARR